MPRRRIELSWISSILQYKILSQLKYKLYNTVLLIHIYFMLGATNDWIWLFSYKPFNVQNNLVLGHLLLSELQMQIFVYVTLETFRWMKVGYNISYRVLYQVFSFYVSGLLYAYKTQKNKKNSYISECYNNIHTIGVRQQSALECRLLWIISTLLFPIHNQLHSLCSV
jgi:hypothetical protein